MHKLIVCADDYAQSPAIDDAIIDLIQRGVLNATSCMTLSPRWPESAKRLTAKIRNQADIGLHLDFTQFSQTIRLEHPQLVLRCLLRLVSKRAIAENINQQLDAFEQAMGTAPDYVDGHLHVHQLPVIREALIEALNQRYENLPVNQRPWLRISRPPASAGRKGTIIRWLGANALEGLATQAGFKTSPLLLGVYDFSGDSAAYFKHWQTWITELQAFYANSPLQSHQMPVVLMCHPATQVEEGDVISHARVQEWDLMRSESFASWWKSLALNLKR